MASRGLRISGSGPVSTRMSVFPFQQTALMSYLPAFPGTVVVIDRRLSDGVVDVAEERPVAVWLAVGGRDLARLHQLLEAPQVLAHLLLGDAAQGLADHLANPAADLHRDPHHGAAAVGGVVEPDRAGVVDLGARQRAPGDAPPFLLVDDLGVPFHLQAQRALADPVGAAVAEVHDMVEALHEAGEVLQPAPEGVELLARLADGDGGLDRSAGER